MSESAVAVKKEARVAVAWNERGVQIAVDAYCEAHGIAEKFLTCNRSKSFCWVQT